ncbi:hypothetical protein LCGC14_1337050 [marine sediment metagenome]|uniref:Uncharacterized protein n=1 Tax=marine sediment metagenome TaxID=412755 RepID=A0A0F9KEN1_9ZZZZ
MTEELNKIQEKLKDSQEQTKTLEILIKKYPDLDIHRDRWSAERYIAKSVNSKVNDVWFNHNCGCCEDSPLQAWPFIIDDETKEKIHTKPACIAVGEKNQWGSGEIPWEDWEENFKKHNINSIIIDKVEQHFKDNKENNWKLEE